jgi:hypothetical protein
MHGRTWLSTALALALTLGLATAARAETVLFLSPTHPTPADRPSFTLAYDSTSCDADFDPAPAVSGNVLTFHGTFATAAPTADCTGSFFHTWQLDPLPAGSYTARVEVGGLELVSFGFAVAAVPSAGPALVVTPAHPTSLGALQVTLSGLATSFCPPSFLPPEVQPDPSGTGTILIAGQNPLVPVTPDCTGPWTTVITVPPPLLPGTYRIEVQISGEVYATQTIVVTPLSLISTSLLVDPQLPTTGDLVTITGGVAYGCPMTFGPPRLVDDRIILPASFDGPCTGPTQGSVGAATVGPLAPGAYLVELDLDGRPAATQGITVAPPVVTLPLVGGRFAVSLARASIGRASAVALTDESGYFWFFDPQNIEVTVKILDGRALNGHYWIFAASMTDLPFSLSVEELGSPLCGPTGAGCPVRIYTSQAGVNGNFIDVDSL